MRRLDLDEIDYELLGHVGHVRSYERGVSLEFSVRESRKDRQSIFMQVTLLIKILRRYHGGRCANFHVWGVGHVSTPEMQRGGPG